MPPTRLSVIVPTLGRPTLARTLEQLRIQAGPEDEIVVVADEAGDVDAAREMTTDVRRRGLVVFHHCPGEGHGYAQRTRGMEIATGTHLAFVDDDDVHFQSGLLHMRHGACEVPVIFRMEHPVLGYVWRDPVLRYGNVGTPMFVVPNDPGRLGVWEPAVESGDKRCGGDYTFITGCVEQMGEPVWREELVVHVGP